ncbi:hypothetical protein GALL_498830 [mine drainage metagenome]|uniref:XdhC Rossmann domain-containing protein n=1 Tax=mine drainage metagenome TaxID=410659 RepID=A0A1J5PY24_9ZZZZ
MIYSDRPAGPPQQAYGDNRLPGSGYAYPDEDNRGLRPPATVGAPGNATGTVQQQPPQGPDGAPMVLSALPPEEQPEAAPANLPPNVTPVRIAQPALAIAGLPPGSVVLVMTHDHQLDFDIVAAALQRPDLAAVGLIGSDTKRARFLGRLARQGIPADRLICPVGLPGIEGKEPAVVALSVAAQILQLQPSLPTAQRSVAEMPKIERSCGDCVCPPVNARAPR